MTQDQVMGLVRWVLSFAAGIVVGKGWLTASQASELSTLLLQIAGPVMAAGGILWAAIANSKTSIIKSATQMDEVDSKKFAAAIVDPDLKRTATQTINQQQDKRS